MSTTVDRRRNAILREVMAKGQMSVAELAEQLGVTTETVRKDLAALQDKNAITKGHGFVSATAPVVESAFSDKEAMRAEEKAAIAEVAAGLIPDGATVFLDTSTTVLALAKLLVMRSGLTVVTNSLDICQALAKSDNDLLMMGGSHRQRSNSCVGAWALAAAEQLSCDVAFFGADGVSQTGPTVRSSRELTLKGALVRRSARSALLMDTSKLGMRGLYTFATWDQLDTLVCERALTDAEARDAGMDGALERLPR